MGSEQPDESPRFKPELTEKEEQKAEERAAIGAHVVHEAIRREGEDELRRPTAALAWSGLAARLAMGFSLIGEGLLRAQLPDEPWRPLISKLGYSMGFLFVVQGRQQVFTENTLTAMIPLLTRRNRKTLANVGRLWGVVLGANLLGALLFAWVMGNTMCARSSARSAGKRSRGPSARLCFAGSLRAG